MTAGDQRIPALRAVAHPVRLRILSMLTAQAMSAAEVARALGIAHASASYHLRVLRDVGELVVDDTEKIRGGTAKRYRYAVGGDREAASSPHGGEDMVAYVHATHSEVVRRLARRRAEGRGTTSDLETWVDQETWTRAVRLLHEALMLLHEEARPAGTEGTIPVSTTVLAFEMEAE